MNTHVAIAINRCMKSSREEITITTAKMKNDKIAIKKRLVTPYNQAVKKIYNLSCFEFLTNSTQKLLMELNIFIAFPKFHF